MREHPEVRIDRVHAAARERFAALFPQLRDPGDVGAHLRMFASAAAIQIAIFLAMRAEGEDVAETWAICEESARRELAGLVRPPDRHRGLLLWLAGWLAAQAPA